MGFEKIGYYLEGMKWVFSQMPIKMEVTFFSAIIGALGMLYVGIISPIIFNYIVIPNIEKKIGRRLERHPLLDYFFLGKWMARQNEIAIYIINRYLAMIFKGDHGLPEYCLRFGLKKAGYTIDMASRFEIIMSFLLAFSYIVVIILGIIVSVLANQLKLR